MDTLIVGCGYLGTRVAARLLASGDRVLATTRSADRARAFAARGIDPVICDVLDPSSLTSLPTTHAVVYCVGLDRAAGATMRRVYVEGLANVLAALPGRPKLAYVSSTSPYGQTDGSLVDEGSLTEPAEEAGRAVLEAEGVLHHHRPEAVVLRFAGIYGPGRLLRAKELLAGAPVNTDPEKWLNLIHVDDGAAAVLAALGHGSPGQVYNVCDDHPVRRRDFYTHLAHLLGAPPPNWGAIPANDRVNRRVSNARMKGELQVALRCSSYRQGLAASLTER